MKKRFINVTNFDLKEQDVFLIRRIFFLISWSASIYINFNLILIEFVILY